MSFIELLFLSAFQGIAEFLPISSSGHLTLLQRFFGSDSASDHLFFTVLLHLGTMAAIIFGLRSTIRDLTRTQIKHLVLALLPLFPLLLLIKPIKVLMQTEWGLSVGFILGGCWMLIGENIAERRSIETSIGISKRSAFLIGIAQAVAVLPGISRLGSTTATARIAGWSRPQAVTFSLLLSIPTVLGGVLVEICELLHASTSTSTLLVPLPFSYYLIGFVVALLVGLFALRLLFWISRVATFRPFGYYCIAVGIFSLIYAA